MKILVITLFTVLLIGCGAPIRLTTDKGSPQWVSELSSRVDKGEKAEAGKIRKPKAKAKAKRKVKHKTVQDIVTPKPIVPKVVQKKPKWVEELKRKVEVKKITKKHRRPSVEVKEDLVEVIPKKEVVVVEKPPAKVDIIFVVDASNSMFYFLREVKNTFVGFIHALAPLDWKIMFTHADHGGHGFFLANWASNKGKAFSLERDGELLWEEKYLTKKTKDYRRVFMDTLRLHDFYEYHEDQGGDSEREVNECELAPGCQGWNEQPLKALKASFVRNRSFFRQGADVVAIVFSDSDEGEHTKPEKRVKAQDVAKAFQAEWGEEGKKLRTYGIIMIPGDEKCLKEHNDRYLGWGGEGIFGVELARMAKLTGGTNSSLCDKSYVPLAKQIVSDFQ